jgi:hypothetical protein
MESIFDWRMEVAAKLRPTARMPTPVAKTSRELPPDLIKKGQKKPAQAFLPWRANGRRGTWDPTPAPQGG